MAVTPRTIFNNPVAVAIGVVTCVGLASLVMDELAGADDCSASSSSASDHVVEDDHVEELDVGAYLRHEQPEFAADARTGEAGASAIRRQPSTANCDGDGRVDRWTESQWTMYLDCLERRGEHHDVLLDEIDRGLDNLSRSLELAVRKGELLSIHGTSSDQIAFLERALDRHDTPTDARLEAQYVRALVWRGGRLDINRAYQTLRKRGPSTTRQVASSCEGKQALAWMNYSLINRSETLGDDVRKWDFRADEALLDDYITSGCHQRIHSGEWSVIAELVGAGILAEQLNGHDGKSTMVRQAVQSFEIRNVRALCRDAVPAQSDLRGECEARVRFELEMTR
ncbi:MAG: hypothetical protein ACQEVA_13165 [Myxococcota bacterium]